MTVENDSQGGRPAGQEAREYYGERLRLAFQHSALLAQKTGRRAEEVLETEDFRRFLEGCRVGSLEAARKVGEMATKHLMHASQPGAWWQELLEYERGYFLQAATREKGPLLMVPRRGVSALCRRFAWAMPELLARLRTGSEISDDLRREVILLFTRTAEGKIHVLEIEPWVEAVFRMTNGRRNRVQIAHAAEVNPAESDQVLESLAEVGAVELESTREAILEAQAQKP